MFRWAHLLTYLSLCSFTFSAQAQFSDGGARTVALGQAGVALPMNTWSLQNPAASAGMEQRVFGIFVTQLFGMSELRLGSAHLGFPTPVGWAFARVRYVGFRQYGESHLGVGLAGVPPTGLPLSLGGYVYVQHQRIEGYASRIALGYQIGMQVYLTETLLIGAEARRLTPMSKGSVGDARMQGWRAGWAYRPVERMWVLVDVVHEPFYPLSLRGGMEVWLFPQLALRGGFTTAPRRMSAGVGLKVEPLAGDFALVLHPFLGWTPALSMELTW